MFRQDLLLDNGGDARVPTERKHCFAHILGSVDLVPIEPRVPAQNSEGLFAWQFLIDSPHEWNEFFIEAGEAARRLRGVPPDFLYLAERHVRSGRITVE